MIDHAKINALIQKYGQVAAGRKINYRGIKLEQPELMLTYRTDPDRQCAPNSFKKKPNNNTYTKTGHLQSHPYIKKSYTYESCGFSNNEPKHKQEKHTANLQQKTSNYLKQQRVNKKKVIPSNIRKEQYIKSTKIVDRLKIFRSKRSQSPTPQKLSKNKKVPTNNFLKKGFDKIDQKLQNYRIQNYDKTYISNNVGNSTRRQTTRQSLPSRFSLNKLKIQKRNKKQTTVRSVDRPRSSNNRPISRSINTRHKKLDHQINISSNKKIKNKPKGHIQAGNKLPINKIQKIKQNFHTEADISRNTRRRRIVTEIETQYSDDKKSYFDEETYRRLTLFEPLIQRKQSDQDDQSIELQAVLKIQKAWRQYKIKKCILQLKNNLNRNNKSIPSRQNFTPKHTRPQTNQHKYEKFVQPSQTSNDSIDQIISLKKGEDLILRSCKLYSEKREKQIQLERFRLSEKEKWDKMCQNLMMIQSGVEQTQMKKHLPLFIQMCQQNLKEVENIDITMRSGNGSSRVDEEIANQNRISNHSESDFDLRRKQYDDAPLTVKLSRKKKSMDESSQKSVQREVSSKKLFDQVENFCLNEQQMSSQSRLNESPPVLVENQSHQIASSVQKISTSDYINSQNQQQSISKSKNKIEFEQHDPIQPITTHQPEVVQSNLKTQKSDDNFQEFLQMIKIDTFFQGQPQYSDIVDCVMSGLASEFAGDLLNHKELLHRFLTARSNLSIDIRQEDIIQEVPNPESIDPQAQTPIQCNSTFVLALVRLFMLEVEQNHLSAFNNQIQIPFGETPENMLKFFRSVDEEELELESNSKYITVLEVETFIDFEPILKDRLCIQSTVSQYFFNHCVFDCLNELLDRYRPFGMKGRPPLCFSTTFKTIPFEEIVDNLVSGLKQLTTMEVGRILFENNDVEQVSKTIQESFRKLDVSVINETSHEWNDNCDLEFQVTFDVSVAVTEEIIRQFIEEFQMFL